LRINKWLLSPFIPHLFLDLMADEAADEMADDVERALCMMEGVQNALRHVIDHYGPKVQGALGRNSTQLRAMGLR